ncbi:MAG: DUF4410 domain-containing protein [Desulfuromonas sp.]|nr:DUF4410 domain-containing protein [Desulfuromonas sp.]
MQRLKLFLVLAFASLLLIGCSAGVARPKASTEEKFCCSVQKPVGSLDVTMTEEGKKSLEDNLKFDAEVLKKTLLRALEAKSLIKIDNSGALPLLGIEIKDVRVRSNFSAVMWGFMAGNDHITGDVVVKDNSGKELDRFEVSAAYALGGLAGGQDDARMSWLYEAFANETIKELTKAAQATN